MVKKKKQWSLLPVIMVAMLSLCLSSCGDDDDDNQSGGNQGEIIQNLKSHKWYCYSTDYDTWSQGISKTTTIYEVYFTSDSEGVMHLKEREEDSALGRSSFENHLDFTYSISGKTITLDGGSNFVFTFHGDYLTEGDLVFKAQPMTSSDYTYLQEHKDGYHGTEGEIDTEVYIIADYEILKGVYDLENGWYSYHLQFGFGAESEDAYRKGMTQMRLTVWADNGCVDSSYKTSNYGKRKTYTLYLSSTERDWYDWILVLSKDTEITFNYELEYYNSKDGQWYDLQSRKLTFYK